MNVQTTLNDAQQQMAHIVVKDKAGKVDAVTTAAWVSADASVCSLVLDSANDPTVRGAMLVAGNPGQTTVTATCGAATLVIAVTVLASEDVEIDINFDSPEDQAVPVVPTP